MPCPTTTTTDRASDDIALDNERLTRRVAALVHAVSAGVRPVDGMTREWALHHARTQATADTLVRHPTVADPDTAPHYPNRLDDLRASRPNQPGLDAAVQRWARATTAGTQPSLHGYAPAFPAAMADLALLLTCAARSIDAAAELGAITATPSTTDPLRAAAQRWRDAEALWRPAWWISGPVTNPTQPRTASRDLLRIELHTLLRTDNRWATPAEIAHRIDPTQLASSMRHATELATQTSTLMELGTPLGGPGATLGAPVAPTRPMPAGSTTGPPPRAGSRKTRRPT